MVNCGHSVVCDLADQEGQCPCSHLQKKNLSVAREFLLNDMREAARELAYLISYAEIVGFKHLDRPSSRQLCEKISKIDKELEKNG